MVRIICAIFLLLALGACSGTMDKVENKANRWSTGWAMGKQYSKVAALGTSTIAQLTPNAHGFGDMIGRSELADGTTIYRHLAPAVKRESYGSFSGLVGGNSTKQNYRLSYFKVGQDGIVKDWATASVPGTVQSCINYIGGIFQKCKDQALIKQALEVYDSKVRTSTGQTIAAWGAIVLAVPFVQTAS